MICGEQIDFNQTSFYKNNRIRYSKLTGKISLIGENALCMKLAAIFIHFIARDYHLCTTVQHKKSCQKKSFYFSIGVFFSFFSFPN